MTKENALQKEKRNNESSFANAPLKKKISFFSSIIIVIGAVMGAGIFFKSGSVLNNSQGSIIFSIFCWLLTVLAVVFMALALIEIASARNDNLSLIGWCQTFNSRIIYKACKNFMSYLYIPLSYFFLPLYFIMSLQDGISVLIDPKNPIAAPQGTENYWWVIIMLITIAISSYFIVACGLSSKIGNIQNWIITSLNFIPAIIAVVAGIAAAAQVRGVVGGQAGVTAGLIDKPIYGLGFIPTPTDNPIDKYTFQAITPGFGLFIGVGAIFFAYDGFYVTAGIQSEMKEPKKTPYALLYGLLIITIVYLSIAISLSIGSLDGTPSGLRWWFKDKNIDWLYAVFQILIGVGVLSILNGFGMWSPRFSEDLVRNDELPFSAKFAGKLNDHRPKVGVVYNLALSIPIIIIFCIIGANGYIPGTYEGSQELYGKLMPELYSFADLMATWSSVGAFTFILISIIGGLRNRSTKLVKVEKSKIFVPCAIGCVILMVAPIFITYFASIADLFLLFRIPPTYTNTNIPSVSYNYQYYLNEALIPRIMTVVVLFLFIFFTFIPTNIEDLILKLKYGSVVNGEVNKLEQIAKVRGLKPIDLVYKELKLNKKTKLNDYQKQILGKNELTPKEVKDILG